MYPHTVMFDLKQPSKKRLLKNAELMQPHVNLRKLHQAEEGNSVLGKSPHLALLSCVTNLLACPHVHTCTRAHTHTHTHPVC